jgi:hypothetical protein
VAAQGRRTGAGAGDERPGLLDQVGFDDSYDFVEAYAWLTLPVERAPRGDILDRAVVNPAKAKELMGEADLSKADARAEHLRETLPAQAGVVQAAASR